MAYAPDQFQKGPTTEKSRINQAFLCLEDLDGRVSALEQQVTAYSPYRLTVCQGGGPRVLVVSGLIQTLTGP